MKREFLLVIAVFSSTGTQAAEYNPGPGLTTGPVSSDQSVFAARHNPALANLVVGSDEHWRFNYLPALSVGLELGSADNFIDEIDELIDLLDDPSTSNDSVQETLDRFNGVLENIGDHGYATVYQSITAPLMPLYWRPSQFSGTFFGEAELSSQVHLRLLDDPLSFDNQNMQFATASSAYVKSGIEKRVAVGYGRALFNDRQAREWGGELHGGIKINLINMELSKQVFRLQALDGKDIEDVIEDEYKNNRLATTNIGIDLGLVWVTEGYRLGLTLQNINSPKFDYGPVGANCDAHPDGSVARNNCEVATYFAVEKGEIRIRESHTRHMLPTIDASWYFTPRFSVSSAVDLTVYDDMVGMENQWLQASSTYDFQRSWLPDLRVGYRKNLTGSELTSYTAGLTLFDRLTFDMEMALDDITVDDSKVPRRLAFSLSWSERF